MKKVDEHFSLFYRLTVFLKVIESNQLIDNGKNICNNCVFKSVCASCDLTCGDLVLYSSLAVVRPCCVLLLFCCDVL